MDPLQWVQLVAVVIRIGGAALNLISAIHAAAVKAGREAKKEAKKKEAKK